jgi:hypothetical protein
MDKSADIEVVVPFGQFVDLSDVTTSSTLPSRVRKLPVLSGIFNPAKFAFGGNLPSHLGYGHTVDNDVNVLTFRLQLGPNMLYWLANAADPVVWTAMDKWAAVKTFVVAAQFTDGQALVMSAPFHIAPQLEPMRKDISQFYQITPRFQESAARAILRGELSRFATTDIESYAVLEHVQGCVVRTPYTGRVLLSPDDWLAGRLQGDVLVDWTPSCGKPVSAMH